MRGVATCAALAVAAIHAAPAGAQTRTAQRIAALGSEAEALEAKGDAAAALRKAEEALAIAEKDPGRGQVNLYEALNNLTTYIPDSDFERQFAVFDRLSALAPAIKGADSFEAAASLAGRNVLAFVLRKPGGSIEAFAQALAKAMPLAVKDRDRAQVAGLAMVLAQLYDATGRHELAVATVNGAAKAYDTPPKVPNDAYAAGLTTLAQRYAEWQDWPRAVDAADRSIAASVAYRGRRTSDIVTAVKVRGGAAVAAGRYDDAEREYREAITLADTDKSPALQSGALLNLSRLYVLTGRDRLALPLLERAADLARALPPQSNTRLVSLLDLYNIAMRAPDPAAALDYAKAAQADARERGLASGPNYVSVLFAVTNASILAGQLDGAAAALTEVEQLLPKAVSARSSRYADLYYARARLATARGDEAEAARGYAAAIARWAETPTGDQAQVAQARAMLTRSLARQRQFGPAWQSGRTGAEEMTKIVVARAASGNAQPIDGQALTVFEAAVDAAWGVRHPS